MIATGAVALGAALLLAACYGPPPGDLYDDADSEAGESHQTASDVRAELLGGDVAIENDPEATVDSAEAQPAAEAATGDGAADGP
jgi:hypothetical protein